MEALILSRDCDRSKSVCSEKPLTLTLSLRERDSRCLSRHGILKLEDFFDRESGVSGPLRPKAEA